MVMLGCSARKLALYRQPTKRFEILIGLASVVYWHITEKNGVGDLRPYIAVQFFPLLAMPVMILCFTPSFNQSKGYWWLFLAYMAAKVLEHYDTQIHDFLGVISGHSLKHIAAALGLYTLLQAFKTRIKTPARFDI